MIKVLFFIVFIIQNFAFAALLPRSLSESDRQQTLKTLGFGSATKLNSDPTPLGGFSGVEFFVSSDVIPTDSLGSLGDRSGSNDQIMINSLGFGKGLFFDVDAFLYFSPFQLQNQIMYTQMGGYLRKVIYTNETRPWRVSLNFHGNGTSYENLIHLTTTGLDAIFSYEWPELVLSAGFGQGRSIGTFIGGARGINNTTDTFTGDLQQQHVIVSASKRWEKYYLSFQYDRYFDAALSLKFGYRL